MSRGAYYNEIDPFAAAWLRNLIDAGLIAKGEVDERSITEVRADDLVGFRQCHFFAGIGVWSYALRRAGWDDDREAWTASCPCQPFSAAGKRRGTDDERHLWPAFHALVDERHPAVIFGEQVASADGLTWLDIVSADLERTGYAFGAADLCAAGVGAPHIRQRLYFVGLGDTQVAGLSEQLVHGGAPRAALGAPAGQELERGGAPARGLADAAGERGSGPGLCDHEPTGERRPLAANDGSDDRLDDTPGARPQGREGSGAQGEARHHARLRGSEHGCSDDRLADDMRDGSCRAGCGCDAPEPSGERPAGQRLLERDRASSGLADAELDQERAGGGAGSEGGAGDEPGAQSSGRGSPGRLADAEHRHVPLEERGSDRRDGPAAADAEDRRTGPTNGFWRDADWLLCRDGRWRAVEPGTFPLAHGASGRVGRLRAYGNAIVAEAAATFIASVMDLLP